MPEESVRATSVAALLGALCYGLLRVFQLAARGTGSAPTIELAERQAAFAVDEFERYRRLRGRLVQLTGDPEGALAAFRSTLDAYYDSAGGQGWLETQVFHYVGNTLTTDFAEILCSRLDEETAEAVRQALTGRTEQEAFALGQITDATAADPEAIQRIRRFTAEIVGAGLTRLREALEASDAVEVVLGGPEAVKEVVLELLGRHRERLDRLGLDVVE